MASSSTANILKEKNDPTRQASQRARHRAAEGPPLLAGRQPSGHPGKAALAVKFIVTADECDPQFCSAGKPSGSKQDANPGQLHETWAKVDRPGVYFGQCLAACGARHGFMRRSRSKITSPPQFRSMGRLQEAGTCRA